MNIFVSPFVEQVILITGIINLVMSLYLFITCRFVPVSHLTEGWMQKGWYKTLYKYHVYAWWLFIPSLLIHATLAIAHFLSGS